MTEPSTAVATLDQIALPALFSAEQVTDVLAQIRSAALAESGGLDVSRPADRQRMKSIAHRVARSKTLLDDHGKELVSEAKAKCALIDAERRRLRDDLDALKTEIRKPADDFDAAEEARIAGHEQAIRIIEHIGALVVDLSAGDLQRRLDLLASQPTRDWREFTERAERAISIAREDLEHALARRIKADADAAELARLQAEEAERKRREHEVTIAALAAEKAKREAEEAAEALRQAEAARVERERQAEADRVEAERLAAEDRARQERERIEAQAKAEREAAEARQRELQEAAALAEQQRKQAELDRIAAENRERAAKEKAEIDRVARNKDLIEAIQRVAIIPTTPDIASSLRTRFGTLEHLASRPIHPEFSEEFAAAVHHARTAIQRAVSAAETREKAQEKARRREAAQAEARRQEAAIEAERRRVAKIAADEEAARQKREADKAHRAKINAAARDAIVLRFGSFFVSGQTAEALNGYADEIATEIVRAIAKGEIPHVRMEY
jgi:colicin import membrane protein